MFLFKFEIIQFSLLSILENYHVSLLFLFWLLIIRTSQILAQTPAAPIWNIQNTALNWYKLSIDNLNKL